MPPAYPPERAPCIYHKKLLRKVLFLQPHIQEAMVDSLEVALIAGALGALIWFIVTPGDGDVFDNFNTTKAEAAVVLTMASVFVHGILSNFQFFPAFLLLGLLTFTVNRCERLEQTCRQRRFLLTRAAARAVYRWREFLINCHTVQARLHDIGVCVGMSVIKPDDLETCTHTHTTTRGQPSPQPHAKTR